MDIGGAISTPPFVICYQGNELQITLQKTTAELSPRLQGRSIEKNYICIGDYDNVQIACPDSSLPHSIDYTQPNNTVFSVANFGFPGGNNKIEDFFNCNLAALIFVQLYSINELSKALQSLVGLALPSVIVVPMRGYGRNDLVVLVGSKNNNIEDITRSLLVLRNKLSSTSYSTSSLVFFALGDKQDYSMFSGSITAVVHIGCSPGAEDRIMPAKQDNIRTFETIGKHDVTYFFENTEFVSIIDFLLETRKKNNSFIHYTNTEIQINIDKNDPSFGQVSNLMERSPHSLSQLVEHEREIDCLLNMQLLKDDSKGTFAQTKRFLVNYRYYLSKPSFARHITLLHLFVVNLLGVALNECADEEDKERKEYLSLDIAKFTYYGSQALSQTLAGERGDTGLLSHHKGNFQGFNRILSALYVFINALFCQITEGIKKATKNRSVPPYEITEGWNSLVYVHDGQGFALITGEILSIPTGAMHKIFEPDVNWLTLSHEISHLIWERICYKAGDEVQKAIDFLSDQFLSEASMNDIKASFSECFAHWFDFVTFYGDIDFYIQSIWQSWLVLPIVKKNKKEYLIRTYVVYSYYCKKIGHRKNKCSSTKLSNLNQLIALISGLGIDFSDLGDNEKNHIIKCGTVYAGMQTKLFEKWAGYGQDVFRSINGKQADSLDAINNIMEGKPVFNMKYPFAVLKEIQKKIFKNPNTVSICKINNAFVDSLLLKSESAGSTQNVMLSC